MWRQTNWCHSVAAPTNIYWTRFVYTEIVVVAGKFSYLNFKCWQKALASINFVDCCYMAMMSYISFSASMAYARGFLRAFRFQSVGRSFDVVGDEKGNAIQCS